MYPEWSVRVQRGSIKKVRKVKKRTYRYTFLRACAVTVSPDSRMPPAKSAMKGK